MVKNILTKVLHIATAIQHFRWRSKYGYPVFPNMYMKRLSFVNGCSLLNTFHQVLQETSLISPLQKGGTPSSDSSQHGSIGQWSTISCFSFAPAPSSPAGGGIVALHSAFSDESPRLCILIIPCWIRTRAARRFGNFGTHFTSIFAAGPGRRSETIREEGQFSKILLVRLLLGSYMLPDRRRGRSWRTCPSRATPRTAADHYSAAFPSPPPGPTASVTTQSQRPPDSPESTTKDTP